MNLITLDFETYFDSDYTLKKMTTEAYIRDPRFQAHLLGVKPSGQPGFWLPREEIASWLAQQDWENTCVLAHHAQFDGLILAHHYGVKPAQWLCTMSMARMALGPNQSASLASLARHYALEEKSVPYEAMKGVRWENMSPALRQQLGDGCVQDCHLTEQIYGHLYSVFPECEYPVVDMTIRMFTEPVLVGDKDMLLKLQNDEWFRKGERLVELDVSAKALQSAESFCALLEAEGEGEEVMVKTSPAGNTLPAIAKTDSYMQSLLEHPNDRIRMLAEARLDVRSTIDETRAGRLYHMASRGPLPVYLNYCGAQNTMRWSGGDKVNFQNFKRSGDIRKAIMAPPGHVIVVGDASQIECRMLNMLAGQMDVIHKFRLKRDIYSELASEFYGFTVDKSMKAERGTGKQLELSCLGPDTLVLTNSGPKPITTVTMEDWLWDGIAWVSHQGLLERGKRIVIQPLEGLFLTPDHYVLCGSTFQEAQNLLDGKYLSQALASGSANSPSQATALLYAEASKRLWSSAVVVHQSTALTPITWLMARLLAVIPVLKKLRATLRTVGKSQNSPLQMQTYDLAFAGPRNRFTIVTSAGPLIVHNCGYGAGADTIKVTAARGTYGPPVTLTDKEALRARDVYRSTHAHVVKLWREADQVLNWLTTGVRAQWRMFAIEDQRIYHSGGTWLDYTGLHWDGAEQQYLRTTRRGTAKMYGAKLVENVVQWIARLAVSEAAVRLTDMDLRPVNTTHDELMLVVPAAEGQQALDALLAELRRAPTWMPEIPFDAEGGFAERYTK